MSTLKNTARLAAAAMVAAATLFPSASRAEAEGDPVNLTIASFRQGSSFYVYAVNLAELLTRNFPAGSTFDSPPIAGGIGNPPLVATGRADLAFGIAVVGTWALAGEHAYSEPLENLRGLIGGWDQYYLVPMARGTGFDSDFGQFFASVRPDANVTLLARGSLGSFGGEQMLAIVGADQEKVEAAGGSFEFGSFDMVKTRFASGTGDVFIQVATRGHPAITEIAQNTDLTFMQPSKEVLAQMTKLYGWGVATLPAGTFPGQDKDVDLPSTTTTLFTNTEMSEDLAYKIVKTVCENAVTMQNAHKALSKFDCETGRVWRDEVNGIPLHDGAIRYFRERGWIQ